MSLVRFAIFSPFWGAFPYHQLSLLSGLVDFSPVWLCDFDFHRDGSRHPFSGTHSLVSRLRRLPNPSTRSPLFRGIKPLESGFRVANSRSLSGVISSSFFLQEIPVSLSLSPVIFRFDDLFSVGELTFSFSYSIPSRGCIWRTLVLLCPPDYASRRFSVETCVSLGKLPIRISFAHLFRSFPSG